MGWTQTTLATIVDASQVSVSGWERGVSAPSDEMKVRLAGAMGCSVGELFPWPTQRPPMPKARPVRKTA